MMKDQWPIRLLIAVALIVVVAGPAEAKKKKGASTEPGRYTDWKGEIDQLEILKKFSLGDYTRIVVEPVDTSATPLPEKDDNTYEPVKTVLAKVTDPFVEGLTGELEKDAGLSVKKGKEGGAGDLLIRARIDVMDPGSQAARYWGGFGAGAARTNIIGEVVDGASGDVLLRFTQERRSGVGAMGGGYQDLLNRNVHKIGEDLALILNSF